MKFSIDKILYKIQKKIIEKSGLFDEKVYIERNHDLSDLDSSDLLRHYIIHGWREGRNPSYSILGSELSYSYPRIICPLTLHAIFKKKNILNPHCTFSVLKNNINKIDIKKAHKLYFEKGEPLEKIALVALIKDEGDIIYENLCWHHFMGIRKFVIIDNNSTDNTVELIEKFKETTKSDLILVKDPIKAKFHGRKITGVSKLAMEWWPDLEWIIPVDADEFWCIERPLKDILNEIPQDIDAIVSLRSMYIPDEYYDFSNEDKFYKKITKRLFLGEVPLMIINKRSNFYVNGKVMFRANKQVKVSFGNHFISLPKNKQKYIIANNLGFHMREFQFRSPNQSSKKITNNAKGHYAKGSLPSFRTSIYENLIKEKKLSSEEIFKSIMIKTDHSINDPLDIENIMKHY